MAMGDALWDVDTQRRENAWLQGRDANLATYKRGADNVMLLFSDRSGDLVLEFPWLAKFRDLVMPLVHKVGYASAACCMLHYCLLQMRMC